MQKKNLLGGVLRWAALGAFVAASFVFMAPILGLGTYFYAASIGVGALAGGILGGLKTIAQNATQERTERLGYNSAPARAATASPQVSAPAPAQDVGVSQENAMSFVAREEARRGAPPQQKAL